MEVEITQNLQQAKKMSTAAKKRSTVAASKKETPETKIRSFLQEQLDGKDIPNILDHEVWARLICYRIYCQLYPGYTTGLFVLLEQAEKLPTRTSASKKANLSAGLTKHQELLKREKQRMVNLRLSENAWIWFLTEHAHRTRVRFQEEPAVSELMDLAMCSVSMQIDQLATQGNTRDYRAKFELSAHAFYNRQHWRITPRLHHLMGHPGAQSFDNFLLEFKKHSKVESSCVVKHGTIPRLKNVHNLFKCEEIIAFFVYNFSKMNIGKYREALAAGPAHDFHLSLPRVALQFPFWKLYKRICAVDRNLDSGKKMVDDAADDDTDNNKTTTKKSSSSSE
jgi:hypothetical protein